MKRTFTLGSHTITQHSVNKWTFDLTLSVPFDPTVEIESAVAELAQQQTCRLVRYMLAEEIIQKDLPHIFNVMVKTKQ